VPDRFVETGAARLATDVRGCPGDRADVLFLHAGVNDRRSWTPVLDALTAADTGEATPTTGAAAAPRRRLVTFDARGFGESTCTPEDFAVQDDALAVLDAVGSCRAVVVASSFGGCAAVCLALEHPERVAGLVLVAPAVAGAPGYAFDSPPELAALSDELRAAEEAGDRDEVNRIEARIWLDGAEAGAGRVGGAARDLFLDMNAIALAQPDPGDDAHPYDAWSRRAEIDCPTLLVAGSLDVPGLVTRSQQMAEGMPHARFELLAGVAHLPQLEADARFLSLVDDFLEDL
jgi:pimeloyl-ACP methyl ester carboxylesterase